MRTTTARLLQIATLIFGLTIATGVSAYGSAYDKTQVGSIEVRELPAGRWITTAMDGGYFERSDSLFRRLFEYIKSNDISMTVPVQASLTHAEMRFYLHEDSSAAPSETDTVQVVDETVRLVASIGGQGAYTEANCTEAKQQLIAWLEDQTEWRADGEPYAVFWNGPFTLWFMKRFEIHVPIQSVKPLK